MSGISLFRMVYDALARDNESTTGTFVPTAGNTWGVRAVRKLSDTQIQAVVDALVLTVRYDGIVTRAEDAAFRGELSELGEARKLPVERVTSAIATAEAKVDAALKGATPRIDAARRLVQAIASEVGDKRVREILFATIVRISRGSSDNEAAADELLTVFAEAFGVRVPER